MHQKLTSCWKQMFSENQTDLEKIMESNGEYLKKGTLGVDGDVEFWDDGTQTKRRTSGTDPVAEDG